MIRAPADELATAGVRVLDMQACCLARLTTRPAKVPLTYGDPLGRAKGIEPS
jgi:hypothetical protein